MINSSEFSGRPKSLVLYKSKPALVVSGGKKISIRLASGESMTVRPKDISLLHPGPLESLAGLGPLEAEVPTAWELLLESGGRSDLALQELTLLLYESYSPETSWAAWNWVADGLYFSGRPEAIKVHSREEVDAIRSRREEQAAEAQAWEEFLQRMRHGELDFERDKRFLREVEDLASGRREGSRLLRALGRAEDPKVAHAFLLEFQVWDAFHNPYPTRLGVATTLPDWEPAGFPDEVRRDLTHLKAYAIDDAGNRDPDDAISWDGERLWVHVADVAALVPHGSPLDMEARHRGETLYLPEGPVPMLPPALIAELGLGLQATSPAFSFGFTCTPTGQLGDLEIVPSRVQVNRLSYAEAEDRLEEEPFQQIEKMAQRYYERRQAGGAFTIDFPEIKAVVSDGGVSLTPIRPLRSRMMVREAMLMAGEAVARWTIEAGLPFPYVVQDPPDMRQAELEVLTSGDRPQMAAGYAALRKMSPSRVVTTPGLHSGLGLEPYSRVTSPLRRYVDLVGHQQLRSYLAGGPLLDPGHIREALGAAEAASVAVRRTERLSLRHWTLVFLSQHPGWAGEGVLIEQRGGRGRVIIPELAFESHLNIDPSISLNAELSLQLKGIDLPHLQAFFQIEP